MTKQNLIIFQLPFLYKILKELQQELNLNIIEAKNEEYFKDNIKNFENYLIVTKKKISENYKQLILDYIPIRLFKLIEKINICFLRDNFSKQSKVIINNYIVDLNSREIFKNRKKIKLTEKEVNTIIYLSKSKSPVNVSELEKNVWSYISELETHTVETHIYRLRKKIFKIFNDDNFIISKKNGYQIK